MHFSVIPGSASGLQWGFVTSVAYSAQILHALRLIRQYAGE